VNDVAPLAIEAVDVRKAFDRGTVRGLDGFTLDVATGEYVAITGPSGCGKSTLLHLLAALDKPDSGSLRVHGVDLAALRDLNEYRRTHVGIVFQLHNLLPHLSALENIEIAMLGTGRPHSEQRTRAMDLLASVDLAGRERRRPPELSGGERQRVALARALANRPRLLLADEPTGNLDTASTSEVLAILDRLSLAGRTIAVITHEDDVATHAKRVIRLVDGQIVEDHRQGPVSGPPPRFAFLGDGTR